MTDPIADMLTRIRNALAVGKDEVVLPMSKIKFNIAKLLEREGWITKAEVMKGSLETKRGSRFDQLRIVLKYDKAGRPAIRTLKRVSKPGLRVYVGKDKIPYVLQGYGMAIISTSQGLLTNKEAKKRGIGGEVLCEIW